VLFPLFKIIGADVKGDVGPGAHDMLLQGKRVKGLPVKTGE
jgi:hypothetical protein